MPGFNRTGPRGQGPGTGRGLGPCGGGMAYGPRGGGRGLGMGTGRAAAYPNYNISPEEEEEDLSREKGFLEKQLEDIKSRLSRLKGQK